MEWAVFGYVPIRLEWKDYSSKMHNYHASLKFLCVQFLQLSSSANISVGNLQYFRMRTCEQEKDTIAFRSPEIWNLARCGPWTLVKFWYSRTKTFSFEKCYCRMNKITCGTKYPPPKCWIQIRFYSKHKILHKFILKLQRMLLIAIMKKSRQLSQPRKFRFAPGATCYPPLCGA